VVFRTFPAPKHERRILTPQSWRAPFLLAHPHGMTLVELIVVVGIIGLMSTVVIARLGSGSIGRPGVQAAARQLALDLRHARVLAIAEGINHYVGFDPQGYTIFRRESGSDVAVESYRTLPKGVNGYVTAWTVEFEPTGAALAAFRCDLLGSGVTYRVLVIAATGTTTVSKL
jgi:prepilin-type N-terminal cleavage/methylation domain-containing protein